MPYTTNIGALARQLITFRAASYARSQAPVSPHPKLTGNTMPEITLLTWLRGKNKCNQFVGDTLSYAGFEMPTYRMQDGSLHYAHAESLPRFPKYFDHLQNLISIQAGDIMVLDWLKTQGENGGHVEIITGVNFHSGDILAASARSAGASEVRYLELLKTLRWNAEERYWFLPSSAHGSAKVYFLRARRT